MSSRTSTRRAWEIGLVHDVVPAEDLDRTCADVVAAVLDAAPGAVAAAKALLQRIARASRREAIQLGVEAIAARRESAEGQEGLRAFLEIGRAHV